MIRLVGPSYDSTDREAVERGADPDRMTQRLDVTELEAAFVSRHRGVGAEATSSGTAALHLALLAAGVRPGDQVATASYTCIAVVHAIKMCGARPVLIDNAFDVERMDYNLLLDQALPSLPSLAAIVVPHAFGVTADIRPVRDVEVPIIEDCAMALGAEVDGKPSGTLGAIATFSLHDSKVISAGVGGMLVANNTEMHESIKRLTGYVDEMIEARALAQADLWDTYQLKFNYQMSNPSAALARNQLDRLPEFIERRRQIANYYDQVLAETGADLPAARSEGSFPFRYMIDVAQAGIKPEVMLGKLRAKGVELGRGVYPAIHTYLGLPGWEKSNAARATSRLVSIPVWPGLDDGEVEYIAGTVEGALHA